MENDVEKHYNTDTRFQYTDKDMYQAHFVKLSDEASIEDLLLSIESKRRLRLLTSLPDKTNMQILEINALIINLYTVSKSVKNHYENKNHNSL